MQNGKKANGPKFNRITTRFSSRDPLGIESIAASISGELCPIVNTVTPRAFYWPFMCWIYYDFYKNSGIKEWKVDTFDKGFLKRQDYFFVLANLLAENPDQMNLVGKQKTATDIMNNPDGPYRFNPDYFITRFGGMQYYNAGCMTMQLITDTDEETGKSYSLPRLTQLGEETALAFEKVIRDTTYYQRYRLVNEPVPKDVLIEYAGVIQLGMDRFDECKVLLRRNLFERNRRLAACAEFAKMIRVTTQTHNMSPERMRHILFDHYSPRGDARTFPDGLKDTIQGWEIVIGRQYFSVGIEMIWKYMLIILTGPCTADEWMEKVLNGISMDILDSPVKAMIPECVLPFDERENMVNKARSSAVSADTVLNGLKIALSVYNRFKDREDLELAASFLDYGRGRLPGTGAISINEWIETVDRFRERRVRDLVRYLMKEYIIEQHKRTCFEKITRSSQSVDGFYFEFMNGLYMKNEHEFQVGFQGIRLIQLMQVMQDLDMFGE